MQKTMKRVLAVCLAALMVLSAGPASGFAGMMNALSVTASAASGLGVCGDDLTWRYDDRTGVLTIGGTGEMDTFSTTSIPGTKMDRTAAPWGVYYQEIQTVVIENGVTSIGRNAFYRCTELTSVVIPDSVKSIGGSAFWYCASLTQAAIPDGVTVIGTSAFRDCTSLTQITIPDSVTSIDSFAFDGSAFYSNSANWTNGALYIGRHFIAGNNLLIGEYTIEPGTLCIAGGAFYGCGNLTGVVIPDSVTCIEGNTFRGCQSLISVTIPESVTSIGYYAFNGCSSLASITIPDSVTSIGYYAFDGTALYNNSLNWTSDAVLYIGHHLIHAKKRAGDYTVAAGTRSVAGAAFEDSTYLTSVTIPDGVASIGAYAFSGCWRLQSVTIPASVREIGWRAFSNCKELQRITIPYGVTKIEEHTFYNCKKLSSVTIPNSVAVIEESAFENCIALSSVKLPDSLTVIGESAFHFCTGLSSANIPYGVTSIGDAAFYNAKLTKITIPDSVTYIGTSAFHGTDFYDNDANWTNGVLYIGSYLVDAKSTLTGDCTVAPGTRYIAEKAFYTCRNMTGLTIPEGVTRIEKSTFWECDSLASVTLPQSLKRIRASAFCGCSALSDVYYSGTYAQWDAVAVADENDPLLDAALHANENPLTLDATGGVVSPENMDYPAVLPTPTKSYTITYKLQASDASDTPLSKTVDCTFRNWNTKPDGSGTPYAAGDTFSADSVMTLYAQWTNPTAGTLAAPTRVRYLFDGWFTDAAGNTQITSGTTISENTTLYAHWTPAVLTGVSIQTTPKKTVYAAGESFDSTGLTLTASYSDGSAQTITTGFACTGFDSATTGEKTVTVTYEGKTATFTVTVNPAVLTGVAVGTQPAKLVYTVGEAFDETGLTLTASYSDGSTQAVTTGFACTGFDSATAGEKTITVTYEEKIATFTVTVQPDPENAPRMSLSQAAAKAGDTVDVTLSIANNPGIIATSVNLTYDTTKLRLIGVQDGGLFGARSYSPGNDLAAVPYTVVWEDGLATQNHTENGVLATFTFEVLAGASDGETPITLQYVRNATINTDMHEVEFELTSGGVEISGRTPGDVNGDGVVDLKDVVILRRFLSGGWNVTINTSNADVNGDHVVDLKDVVILRRFLSGGWNITLI